MTANTETNVKQDYDNILQTIADYVMETDVANSITLNNTRYNLMDSLGCAILALNYPACTKLLGPIVPDLEIKHGVNIPGTDHIVDPIKGAFDLGAMIRWLDYNDTWLAAEWGHPSDNIGGILAVADYLSRNGHDITMKEVLISIIKAHEIQGILALENSFNRVGLDHVILVKVASTAVITKLLGGNREQIIAALSHAFVDGQSLRTYRHAPNAGSRKSWAAGDATSRAVRLAMIVLQGEMGYPSVLTAKTWGFYDVSFKSQPFKLNRPLNTYCMDNILYKISYPAEFHSQTAVECAIKLHPEIKNKFDDIEKIVLTTHESAIRIISKTGPLHNPADRDHCLQYITAIGLIYGKLTADHYEDKIAENKLIDSLRDKMEVVENKQFSVDYLDPDKRSIANSIQIVFKDGSKTDNITIEYPIGHKRRREEGIPKLIEKFEYNIATQFDIEKSMQLLALFDDQTTLENMPVKTFMDYWKK